MADKRPYPSFLIFRDKEGNWRWNYAGPGGRILAASAQAYSRGAGCVRAIQLLKGSSDVPVVGRPDDMKAARAGAAARQASAGTAAAAVEGTAPPAQPAKAAEKKPAASMKAADSNEEKKSK